MSGRRARLLQELPADHDRPVQLIDDLKDLEEQILAKCRRSQVVTRLSLLGLRIAVE